jgi:hypothetical protein
MVGTALARLCPPYALLMSIVIARRVRAEAIQTSFLALDCFAHARNDTENYFFTSGHSLASSGLAASSGAMVATSL